MSRDNLHFRFNEEMELLAKSMRPFQDAISQMERLPDYACILENPLVNKLGVMDDALRRGVFSNELAPSVSEMLVPYHDISGTQEVMDALGSSFIEQIRPDFYTTGLSVLDRDMISLEQEQSYINQRLQGILEPSLHFPPVIDTTWLQENGNWLIEKSTLAALEIEKLGNLNGAFAQLCRLEQETSQLKGIPEVVTSAALQIGSIMKAFEESFPKGWHYDDLATSARLLDDYCELAIKQHELIQESANISEIEWRLGVLDATSRCVDRQVTWSLEFAEALSDEDIVLEEREKGIEAYPSIVPFIPTYIGYTRKASIRRTPAKGLMKSALVAITEKGKTIGEYVVQINLLRRDIGAESVFTYSDSSVRGMMNIGNVVCTTDAQLGRIIDSLYFIFYENLERIKDLVGDGDKNHGDALIRSESIYQSIFDVKTIRNDLRHDLDHGADKKRKANFKKVSDCYRKYCNHRPMSARDYMKLQGKLYDGIIALEVNLIQKLLGE